MKCVMKYSKFKIAYLTSWSNIVFRLPWHWAALFVPISLNFLLFLSYFKAQKRIRGHCCDSCFRALSTRLLQAFTVRTIRSTQMLRHSIDHLHFYWYRWMKRMHSITNEIISLVLKNYDMTAIWIERASLKVQQGKQKHWQELFQMQCSSCKTVNVCEVFESSWMIVFDVYYLLTTLLRKSHEVDLSVDPLSAAKLPNGILPIGLRDAAVSFEALLFGWVTDCFMDKKILLRERNLRKYLLHNLGSHEVVIGVVLLWF